MNYELSQHAQNVMTEREIPVEWLFVDMETTLYGDAIIPREGKIQLPAGAGLGLDPDPAVIARFRKN